MVEPQTLAEALRVLLLRASNTWIAQPGRPTQRARVYIKWVAFQSGIRESSCNAIFNDSRRATVEDVKPLADFFAKELDVDSADLRAELQFLAEGQHPEQRERLRRALGKL